MTAPDPLGVALMVGQALGNAGARWAIGGSIASSAFGDARATRPRGAALRG